MQISGFFLLYDKFCLYFQFKMEYLSELQKMVSYLLHVHIYICTYESEIVNIK